MSELLGADVGGDVPPAAGWPTPPAPAGTAPFVTICVPALNEAAYIEDCLGSLLGQWPAEHCEIIVADGGSTDGTQGIVRAIARRHPHVRLVANPRRIQAAGVNLAARLAAPRATVLLRADAHAVYPSGFARRCVTELLRTGATSVVVPMRTVGEPAQPLQRAIAAAQSSRLGNGGAAHRATARSGFVEHGHHAAFDLGFFRALGGYDESFTHNEDAEFDHRAALAGGRIWMAAEVPVVYFPRRTLGALARQYYRHGAGRARTLAKHQMAPRPRQIAPLAALGLLLAGAAMAPFAPQTAALVLAYPACCLAWAIGLAVLQRDRWLLAAGPALLAMHLSWGVGFLDSMVRQRERLAPPPLPWPRAPTAGIVPLADPPKVPSTY